MEEALDLSFDRLLMMMMIHTILAVALYGCESLSFTLRKEQTMHVFGRQYQANYLDPTE